MQTSVDNTVNVQNYVKDENKFFMHTLSCYAAKHKVLVIPVFYSKLDHIGCNMNHKCQTLHIVWIMSVEVSLIIVLLRVK